MVERCAFQEAVVVKGYEMLAIHKFHTKGSRKLLCDESIGTYHSVETGQRSCTYYACINSVESKRSVVIYKIRVLSVNFFHHVAKFCFVRMNSYTTCSIQ